MIRRLVAAGLLLCPLDAALAGSNAVRRVPTMKAPVGNTSAGGNSLSQGALTAAYISPKMIPQNVQFVPIWEAATVAAQLPAAAQTIARLDRSVPESDIGPNELIEFGYEPSGEKREFLIESARKDSEKPPMFDEDNGGFQSPDLGSDEFREGMAELNNEAQSTMETAGGPVNGSDIANGRKRFDGAGAVEHSAVLNDGPVDLETYSLLSDEGTQGTVYVDKDRRTAVKVFDKIPGVQKRHIDALVGLGALLRRAGEPVVSMQAVRLSDGRWAVRMPYMDGTPVPEVLGHLGGNPFYSDPLADKIERRSRYVLDRIDELTGGLADRRIRSWRAERDANLAAHEEDFENFIYHHGRLVNVDPINMSLLVARMDLMTPEAFGGRIPVTEPPIDYERIIPGDRALREQGLYRPGQVTVSHGGRWWETDDNGATIHIRTREHAGGDRNLERQADAISRARLLEAARVMPGVRVARSAYRSTEFADRSVRPALLIEEIGTHGMEAAMRRGPTRSEFLALERAVRNMHLAGMAHGSLHSGIVYAADRESSGNRVFYLTGFEAAAFYWDPGFAAAAQADLRQLEQWRKLYFRG